MAFSPEQRVMWLANVRALPFRERVETTARGGFGWLTTSPADYDRTRAAGLSAADMKAIAADWGVRLSYLDPLAAWVPDWQPDGVSAEVAAYFGRDPDDFFHLAEDLEVDKIHVVGTFPEGRYPTDVLIEHYAAVCDRAARHGLGCTIEALPFFGIRTLEQVSRIVREANRPNGGIVFDTWHYFHGGRDDALLASLPPGMIATVQLADGTRILPPGRTLLEDCVFHRRPLGEGNLPIAEMVGLLQRAGHLHSVGPEIFSSELDTLNRQAILQKILPGFEGMLDRFER